MQLNRKKEQILTRCHVVISSIHYFPLSRLINQPTSRQCLKGTIHSTRMLWVGALSADSGMKDCIVSPKPSHMQLTPSPEYEAWRCHTKPYHVTEQPWRFILHLWASELYRILLEGKVAG